MLPHESMRVVVTGASGFLGSAVLQRLMSAGVDCVGVSRREIAGLYHVNSYVDAPKGDVLIHLAETNDRFCANAGGVTLENEALQTLQRVLVKGYRKVIYASSGVLYGDSWLTPRKVSDTVQAVDTYTRIKQNSEKAVLARNGTVARLGNLYGPGMAASNVLSHILGQLGDSEIKLRALEPVRDFLWVHDAAQALLEMVMKNAYGILNVGSGIGTSVLQLANLAIDAAGTCQKISGVHTLTRPSHIVLDIEETVRVLDWKPRTTLRDGIQVLVNMKSKS